MCGSESSHSLESLALFPEYRNRHIRHAYISQCACGRNNLVQLPSCATQIHMQSGSSGLPKHRAQLRIRLLIFYYLYGCFPQFLTVLLILNSIFHICLFI